ncbi:MAG: glycosyltransferase family 4 protein [Cytophagales bacterium]|nr:glycosyltransferase family 4 protein [Cytophagales bacterium]
MKIAFISTMKGCAWGGSEELWVAAAAAAMDENNEVLVSSYDWGEMTGKKILSLWHKGATLELRAREKVCKTPSLGERVFNKLKRLARISASPARKGSYDFVLDFDPQLVLISQGATYDFLEEHDLLDMLQKLNKPYFVVCHSYTEAFALHPLHRKTAVRFFNGAKGVFLVARSHIGVLQRQLAARLNQVTVVRNPVNLQRFGVVPLPAADATQFAVVGHLEVIWKGQDLLFELLGQDKWLARNWTLNVYGSGGNQEYLEDLCKFYQIGHRVVFHGFVSDIRKVWTENHLLLMPSRQEVAPIALVEAMLCGRTAVVTNVGGIKEWIRDEENGFVAEAPTVNCYDATLERAWGKRMDWALFGERAYQQAMNMVDAHPGKTLIDKMIDA